MVFEQKIANDSSYYHQDRNGWKKWCDLNIKKIAADFTADYPVMTRTDQIICFEINDVRKYYYEFIKYLEG